MNREILCRCALAVTGLAATLCASCLVRDDPVEIVSNEQVVPLLVVGIDGATFDRAGPLMDAGRMPHLAELMARGAWGPLETIEPTVSPAIWTTIATGKLPQEHGILGFEGVPGRTMTTLPTSQMRRVRAFWNVFAEHGRTVGLVGWWATWPAEALEGGYVVSDRVTYTRMEAAVAREEPKPLEVFPPELAKEVLPLVRAPGQITPDDVRRFMAIRDAEIEALIRGTGYRHGELLPEFMYVCQSDRSTADIATHLLRTRPTDVTAVAFYGVDAMSHLAWHYMEPEAFAGLEPSGSDIERFGGLIDEYYAFVDELLGQLLAAAPPNAAVLVFSDHGFGPTGRLPWSGGHGRITPGAPVAPDGILVMAGPPFRHGIRLDRPHVLDFVPMLLYLEGFPLARDMRGGVFTEAFTESFVEAVPLRGIDTYETRPLHRPGEDWLADEALDAATIEKLRALGYLD